MERGEVSRKDGIAVIKDAFICFSGGTLKSEVAKELGFSADVKVVAGAGDNAAAAVGTGTVGDGQDAKLKSVTIKEKYMPYVTDNVSQVYLVNKATGMVLDCNPDSKVISAAKYDSEKKSQLFCIENLTYHILRVRNIATNLHVMNNGDKVIVGKPGDDWRVHDPKYALFLTPTDDEGYYSLGLSPEARIGLSSANSTEVVGNRSGQIEDLDKWKIVTADEMKKQ